jgi:hypothetical protein
VTTRRSFGLALAAAAALALAGCEAPASERMLVATATANPSAIPVVPAGDLSTNPAGMVSPGSPGLDGPEQNPIPVAQQVAPPGYLQENTDVHGIKCLTKEQMAFHVHTRLTVFVNGAARQIPAAIGIAPPLGIDQKPNGMFFINNGSCFAWLHTHTPDGIIHIESPIQRQFTLGDFFAVWGQPLGPEQVGPFHGTVTAFYNGKWYVGDPRNIPIGYHVEVQLDVGNPIVAPEHIAFGGGL